MEKKTEKEIKQEVERLLEEIALLKEEAREQGLAFSSLSEEELVQMVRGESPKSPRIVGQAWTGSRTPGSSARYSVYIHNPDPTRHSPLFMTISLVSPISAPTSVKDGVVETRDGRSCRQNGSALQRGRPPT